MRKLLWAERQKMRRSKIIWIAVCATIMLAGLVFVEGLSIYEGEELHYGRKILHHGMRQIDGPGWYMDEAELLGIFLALPAVVALVGSYSICREQTDDTIKSLRLIPIDEAKLTVAKMILTFTLSILLFLLLFMITCIVEMVMHFSELSVQLVFSCFKEYVLDGVGTFLAISPMIAIVPFMKKEYWVALVVTETYSIGGMLANMSPILKNYYPIDAIFNFSGYHIVSAGQRIESIMSLMMCGFLSAIILWRLNEKQDL